MQLSAVQAGEGGLRESFGSPQGHHSAVHGGAQTAAGPSGVADVGRGDGEKVKVRPSHGSMMIGVSWLGATWLLDNWQQMWRSHFDLSLLWACQNFSQELQASFIYPSIGHYVPHDSGILLEERKATWKEWWVQEGV